MNSPMFLAFAAFLSSSAWAVPDQAQLNGLADTLLGAYRVLLPAKGWNTAPFLDFDVQIFVMLNGVPSTGNFSAIKGTIGDFASLSRSGDVVLQNLGDHVELRVPMDFGKLKATYGQYMLRLGGWNYFGVLVAFFNQATASAVFNISGPVSQCKVTIGKVSIESFGEVTTNILQPPPLAQKIDAVKFGLLRTFMLSTNLFQGILQSTFLESIKVVNLCTVL